MRLKVENLPMAWREACQAIADPQRVPQTHVRLTPLPDRPGWILEDASDPMEERAPLDA